MPPLQLLHTVVCLIIANAILPGAQSVAAQQTTTESKVGQLEDWLAESPLTAGKLQDMKQQPFADVSLSKDEAEAVAKTVWQARERQLKIERATEMEQRSITIGDKQMPFWFKTFGESPATGRSLYISMHGGGNAPAQVNDQQYENQKKLYQPEEGIYLVPRAPTDTWNLWHEAHIDQFFARLITNMVIFENVNPDRVYIMGYSAGGDGVYQLAPRMADRWAAAAMMAGHPNETKPNGLRNLPFTIHMGARDGAYSRNKIAGQWKTKLSALQKADPDGYVHYVELHSGRGHWMNLEDAVAVPWMAKFNRQRFPKRIVWLQDDTIHERFYWLQVGQSNCSGRPEIIVAVDGNTVTIEQTDVEEVTILLHDELVDMDRPVIVRHQETVLFDGPVKRSVATITESLLQRDEPNAVVFGRVTVKVPTSVSTD